jgi:putative ABC transport system substrate-binding protein
VASLARPGGNVTGLALDAGAELEAKRLALLKEAVPTIRRVAYLGFTSLWEGPGGESVREAAPRLGVTLIHIEQAPNDYAPAFSAIMRERLDGIFVSSDPHHWAHRQRITEFARQSRLPALGYSREFADAGALLSYGVDLNDLFRRAAGYVDRILKGAKPADLPVEQPTKFELVINLKTAKALGLTIPPSMLARADEVIPE